MKKQTDWGARRFRAENPDNPPFHIVVKGRVRWALEALMGAGARGVTPITAPAPRWAAYVHSLREMDVRIETITEAHGGAFRGTHARYVLRSVVTAEGLE